MYLFAPILVSILGSVLLLAGLMRKRHRFVLFNPRYEPILRTQGLSTPDDFLALPAIIVSGHPGRNVGRLTLGSLPLFLKREEHISWRTRLGNFLAGFGFVSLSEREADVLRTLSHLGVNGPEWVAVGIDGAGR